MNTSSCLAYLPAGPDSPHWEPTSFSCSAGGDSEKVRREQHDPGRGGELKARSWLHTDSKSQRESLQGLQDQAGEIQSGNGRKNNWDMREKLRTRKGKRDGHRERTCYSFLFYPLFCNLDWWQHDCPKYVVNLEINFLPLMLSLALHVSSFWCMTWPLSSAPHMVENYDNLLLLLIFMSVITWKNMPVRDLMVEMMAYL